MRVCAAQEYKADQAGGGGMVSSYVHDSINQKVGSAVHSYFHGSGGGSSNAAGGMGGGGTGGGFGDSGFGSYGA